MYSYPYLTGLGLVLVLSNAHGQTEREHDSHAHGAAQLDVVIDGNSVLLEFNSPWANLVGFEHSPSTDEQHEAVDTAMATLDSADALFELNADCTAQSSDVLSSMEEEHDEHAENEGHDEHDEHAENEGHDEHDEHAENEEHGEHDEHAENEEHDEHDEHAENEEHDEHHDDEKHDDHDSGEHASAHSEVSASYAFTCEDVSELQAIDVLLISQWPGIEQLSVQLAGPKGQSAVTLSADQQRIDLDAVL